MLNKLSAFGKTGETKKDKEFPTIRDNKKVQEVATNLIIDLQKAAALETVIKSAKELLAGLAKDLYFKTNLAGGEYQSSVVVETDRTKVTNNVLVNFTEGYQVKELNDQMRELLGPVAFGDHFDETFSLTIDGSQIEKDKQEAFVDDLLEVLNKHGIDPSAAVKAKHGIKPKKGFNPKRMTAFDEKTNMQIDAIYPIPLSVSEHKKTKGDESKVRKPAPTKK